MVRRHADENQNKEQANMQDKGATPRALEVGDQVLALLPSSWLWEIRHPMA
jgi:hypothetical protein